MHRRGKMYYILLLSLLVFAAANKNDHGTKGHKTRDGEGSQPVVATPSGAIRGSMMLSRRGRPFEAFRGIRYAEPPVGELRFQPPVPILTYKEQVDASEEGPACPLPASERYFHNLDEDCLRINVYTPNHKSSHPLPVIFYIHAGGFYGMSGRSDLAGPHYLLDKDVVLVTINYRLGSLGFLSTGDALAPGNNGFKDQVVALKWVQRNIASFGGDPNLVTISGCSAGSHSVLLYMLSPMTKGLFHRAIGMSASPVGASRSPTDLLRLAVRQAELLSCPTNSSKAIIDCLKTKPWRDLGYSLRGFYEFGYDPVRIWRPVVERDFGQERFLEEEPLDLIRSGNMHSVPYMISQTRDEFFWFAFNVVKNDTLRGRMNKEWYEVATISFVLPRENTTTTKLDRIRKFYLGDEPLSNNTESAKRLGRLYGDSIVAFPVHRTANLMCRHSPHPVYYYEFAYTGTHSHYQDPVTKKPVAIAHHDDLIYLFSLSYRFPSIGTDGPDAQLVDRMTSIWYTFAKQGNPNPRGEDLPELKGLNWPAMTPDDRVYLEIGKELTVKTNLKEDRTQLWDELYPIQY